MKNILIAIVCICLQFAANAQAIELKPAPVKVAIDGSLSEWGTLPYSDKKATISYIISNDHTNLYLALKTRDTVLQGNILGSGITFALSKDDKNASKITFPIRGREDPSEYMNLDNDQVEIKAALTRYKRLGVENIKAIKPPQLSSTNPYGIKITIGYTEDGYMIYEEAIPLSLIYPDGTNGKYAYSITINGLVRKVVIVERWGQAGRGKFMSERQINQIIQSYGDKLRIGGPMPSSDSIIRLTADTEIKGEFVLAR